MNFEEEIKNIATSIKKEFGIKIDNKLIIKEFIKEFDSSFCNILESKI